jgi:hypothetical protein
MLVVLFHSSQDPLLFTVIVGEVNLQSVVRDDIYKVYDIIIHPGYQFTITMSSRKHNIYLVEATVRFLKSPWHACSANLPAGPMVSVVETDPRSQSACA